jgi:hypothetical protein
MLAKINRGTRFVILFNLWIDCTVKTLGAYKDQHTDPRHSCDRVVVEWTRRCELQFHAITLRVSRRDIALRAILLGTMPENMDDIILHFNAKNTKCPIYRFSRI